MSRQPVTTRDTSGRAGPQDSRSHGLPKASSPLCSAHRSFVFALGRELCGGHVERDGRKLNNRERK